MFQYKKNIPNKKQIDSNTLLLGLYSQIDSFTNYFRVVQEICY